MSFDYSINSETPRRQIDYAAELNPAQLEAVTAEPGPLLVIAGAGSGKTRALTYRVAWLVDQGSSPGSILLLTFTNKAAREMVDRVSNLASCSVEQIWGGTFHSIGNRILRRHAPAVNLRNGFSILDRDDSSTLMRSCLEDAGLKGKSKTFPKPDLIIEILSLAANKTVPINQMISHQFGQIQEFTRDIEDLAERYEKKKKESNAVDYDDLLTLPLKLLRENEDIRNQYQMQFNHVLVDEYQDTNSIQAEFVDLIGAKHHHIMAVGDDAQSIYSWRGANFQNIMTFPERHEGTRIIRLETNYRSIPEIINLANQAIAQNTQQFPKNLVATRPPGVKPAVVALEDGRQQASFVAQRVVELAEESIALKDIAILYRSHFHCMELQMEFTRRNIPFNLTSGLRFFEQAHVKDVAAFIRFLTNQQDEVSFRRIAGLFPGVGEKTCSKIWMQINQGQALFAIKVPEKARAVWDQWVQMHQDLLDGDIQRHPQSLIQIILDMWYDDYLKTTYANYENRLEDLNQLQSFAKGFSTTEEFLTQLSLLTNVDTANGNSSIPLDAVRMSSIHQAKGLEFPVVFLVMLCEGLFPSSKSMEDKNAEEEERRLFYVAVTRARDELYLTYPRMRSTAGYGDVFMAPSRFLSDFSREACNMWRIKPQPTFGGHPAPKHYTPKDEDSDPF